MYKRREGYSLKWLNNMHHLSRRIKSSLTNLHKHTFLPCLFFFYFLLLYQLFYTAETALFCKRGIIFLPVFSLRVTSTSSDVPLYDEEKIFRYKKRCNDYLGEEDRCDEWKENIDHADAHGSPGTFEISYSLSLSPILSISLSPVSRWKKSGHVLQPF